MHRCKCFCFVTVNRASPQGGKGGIEMLIVVRIREVVENRNRVRYTSRSSVK